MLPLVLGLVLFLALPTAAQQSSSLTIYLYRRGQAAPLARAGTLSGDPQADAITLLTSLLVGPTSEEQASGYTSAFPPDAELVAVTVSGAEVTVDLEEKILHLPGDEDVPFDIDPFGLELSIK